MIGAPVLEFQEVVPGVLACLDEDWLLAVVGPVGSFQLIRVIEGLDLPGGASMSAPSVRLASA